ncbi:MAG: class II aldolase/adducin family protein [Candidatus Cloacimonetes bacterium]|nr:class II aldolase/adducin family protein [Candidatus Cloacimonadota bacterium]
MQISELANFQELLAEIAETARLIHLYGWAEANAGNLSIKVNHRVKDPKADTNYYLVSRTGSRYRQTALNPEKNLLLIEVGKKEIFHPPGARPTMEWISHRCLQKAIGENTVVLHTHPAEIIALAKVNKSCAELNRIFADILPELPLYLPDGFAIAPLHAPGSQALCDASLSCYRGQKALIWSGHGILCFGKSLDEALDYMEIVVKAAKVFFLLGV